MLLLELLYILAQVNTVMGRPDVAAAAYRFDCEPANNYYLKTLLQTYAKKYNYSIAFHPFEDLQNQSLANYDFTLVDPNEYRFLDPNPFTLSGVVPFLSLILIVPATVKMDKFLYFALPFRMTVWAALLACPFGFAVILRIINNKSSFLDHLQMSLGIMLSQPPKKRATKNAVQIICILFICFSSMMTTIYSSSLGSFLINTIDKSDFTFLCPESRVVPGTDHLNYKIVGFSEYLDHVIAMDMRYAYCVSSTLWAGNLNSRQSYYFKTIPPWKSTSRHSFRVNKNFVHLDEFNRFLVNAYSFGLLYKYNMELPGERSTPTILAEVENDDPILRYKDFRFPKIVFLIGIGVGWAVFCIEVFVGVLRKKKKEVFRFGGLREF